MSKEEQEALEILRRYDDIIIKQADKGSAVVVLDRISMLVKLCGS